MRTRKSVLPDIIPNSYVHYSHQTRSDSNGKVKFLHLRRGNPLLPPRFKYKKVRKAKPYVSVSANGVLHKSANTTEKYNHDVTNSQLLYSIFEQNPQMLESLEREFLPTKAVNGAIDGALRYGDLLLLVSLKEANQTAAMLKSVWSSLYKFIFGIYDKIKHLKPKEAYLLASDLWLQYRYGWRPLFFEIGTLYKVFTEKGVFDTRSSYGLSKVADLDRSFDVTTALNIDGVVKQFQHQVTVKEVTHKAGFNYFNKLDSRNVSGFETLGLSISSLLQTAHELIPFSFILDMFINVGDCIKTLDFKANVSPFNGYLNSRYVVDVKSFKSARTGVSSSGATWSVSSSWEHGDLRMVTMNFVRFYRKYVKDSYFEYLPIPSERPKFINGFEDALKDGDFWPYDNMVDFNVWHTDDDGKKIFIIDENVTHISAYPRSHPVYFTQRWYNYTYEGKEYNKSVLVVEPFPKEMQEKDFGGPLFDDEANNAIIRQFLENRIVNGVYQGEYVDGRYLTPEQSLDKAGLYNSFLRVIFNDAGKHVVAYNNHWPTKPRYLIPPFTERETYNYHSTSVTTEAFSGVYLERELKENFEFNMTADLDLTKSQTADLLIFGQRLVSAMTVK